MLKRFCQISALPHPTPKNNRELWRTLSAVKCQCFKINHICRRTEKERLFSLYCLTLLHDLCVSWCYRVIRGLDIIRHIIPRITLVFDIVFDLFHSLLYSFFLLLLLAYIRRVIFSNKQGLYTCTSDIYSLFLVLTLTVGFFLFNLKIPTVNIMKEST